MTKYIISALLIFVSTIFMEAKNPLNYYANKAEESLSMRRYEDALDYARQEIIDYENNPNGYYQAAISLYALQQPGQSLSMINKAIERAKKDKPCLLNIFLPSLNCLKKWGIPFRL